MSKQAPHSITVWSRFPPTSGDPMDYDYSVHHITMRSVHASLVSVYKQGEYAPQIAKYWETNSDKSEWKVLIDKQWTFSNGDFVTPKIVVDNFKRVLFLKNQSASKSGLLEFIIGASNFKSIKSEIEGIKVDGDYVIFKFNKPIPDFLDKISFGLYAIAHPKDYSSIDGKWKDKRQFISSGPYAIETWEDKKFDLTLRDNLYKNNDKIHIKKISFTFSPKVEDAIESDIIIREKYNPSIDKSSWTFASSVQDNNITYVKVMKWNQKNSVFNDRETRVKLRNIFYESLEKSGLNPTKSFFPLSIKGVQEFDFKKGETLDFEQKKLLSQPYFTSENKKELGNIYKDAYQNLCKSINAKEKINDYPENESDEEELFDIQFLATGIVIDSPMDDIKFMFLSKQGIKLPDETGEIKSLLENDTFDIQEINRLLWDQAIIWPIRHYSMGFWVKNSSDIDYSDLNVTIHPIDFQFLKWK